METFAEYLDTIEDADHRARIAEVLDWVTREYPQLKQRIAWNQPMFTHEGTFIIGFSVSKHHFALSPEPAGIQHFADEIVAAGYDHTKMLMRIRWEQPVDWELLRRMIDFNIEDKAGYTAFWRK